MQISICPTTFDIRAPLAAERLLPGSDVDQMGRRVTRTPTLDGGSVFYDSGYAVSDRNLTILLPKSDALVSLAQWFTQYHSDLTVSTPNGIYYCVITDITVERDILTINLFIKANA